MTNQMDDNNLNNIASQDGVTITHVGFGLLFLLVLFGLSLITVALEPAPQIIIVEITTTRTRTPRPTRTPTATVNATSSATSTEQNPAIILTNTPTPSPPPTHTHTPTMTPTVTESPTLTPSSTPTISPTLTATPNVIVAESIQAAAFFAAPVVSSGQLGAFVEVGETVEVIGRTQNNGWLLARHPSGQLGWVTASFFAVNATDLATIPIMGDVVVTVVPDAPVPTNTPESILPNIVYWNNISSQANDDGTWQVLLAIRAPRGAGYSFATQDGLTISPATFIREEGLYDIYNISIDGMSCGGSLINGLTVTRNGQLYTIRSEFSPDEETDMFIASHDC